MDENVEILSIGNRDVVVGGAWETESKYSGLLLKLSVRAKAASQQKHCASVYQPNKDLKDSQYALYGDAKATEGLIAGDATIANNIPKWLKTGRQSAEVKDRPVIFIFSIPREENSVAESRFWMLPVEANGLISSESQSVLNDRYSLNAAISLFALTTENFDIIRVDTDGETTSFLSEQETRIPDGCLVTSITEEMLEQAFKNSTFIIKRIYKPSKIKVKKVAMVASALCITVVAAFCLSYITQKEAINYFSETEKRELLERKSDSLKNKIKGLREGTYWDDASYRRSTLEQFVQSLEKSLYKPIEIAILLREINRTLPIFAADWRLTKLSYERNRFFARYERSEQSKGVYFMLDNVVAAFNKQSSQLSILPYNLIDQGETRIYSVTPSAKLQRQKNIVFMKTLLREEDNVSSNLRKNGKRLIDRQQELSDLFRQHDTLGFKQTWIERGTLPLFEKVAELESRIAIAESGFNKSYSAYKSNQRLELENELVLGNVMDFVTMLQLDSFFQWSFPKLERTFPDSKTLDKRNKNKPKSGDEIYGPAIESYSVEISTRGSEEEGKVKSYGISDMIHLGFLINKPFVNVDLVEYDKMSEQWRFLIHFNRKTPEYQKRIIKNKVKEVKS
jgi:hypothetical protein